MAKKSIGLNTGSEEDPLVKNVEMIKMLLVLITDNMGIRRKDIANMMGISEGRLSQMLNPKKYK